MSDSSCPNCGEPLDDFAECGCSLELRPARKAGAKKRKPYTGGTMRDMVARKLARQARERGGPP